MCVCMCIYIYVGVQIISTVWVDKLRGDQLFLVSLIAVLVTPIHQTYVETTLS